MSLDPDNVAEDPRFGPGEKETVIRFAKEDDLAFVWTAEAGLMRRFIRHPEFEVDERKSIMREDSVTAVYGTIPVECLSVIMNPRKDSGHASMVTHRVLDSK